MSVIIYSSICLKSKTVISNLLLFFLPGLGVPAALYNGGASASLSPSTGPRVCTSGVMPSLFSEAPQELLPGHLIPGTNGWMQKAALICTWAISWSRHSPFALCYAISGLIPSLSFHWLRRRCWVFSSGPVTLLQVRVHPLIHFPPSY